MKENRGRQVAASIAGFVLFNVFFAWMLWIPGDLVCDPERKTASGIVSIESSKKSGSIDLRLDKLILDCSRDIYGLAGCGIKPALRPLMGVETVTAVYQRCEIGMDHQNLTLELRSASGQPLSGYEESQLRYEMKLARESTLEYFSMPFMALVVFMSSLRLRASLRKSRGGVKNDGA
ncbi:hypothetical protein [Bordetella ansorpii]|uniref:hypothetical protein n=1 Tax=Bordetella ansorpii TaxID=288768 RepID=UPI000A9A632F|nr:hypothetical protein [Bordetella ansorpii]